MVISGLEIAKLVLLQTYYPAKSLASPHQGSTRELTMSQYRKGTSGLGRRGILVFLTCVSLAGIGNLSAQEQSAFDALFAHSVPLSESGAGSYSVSATLGGVEMEFLLDTGASLVTVSASLFKQIQGHHGMAVKVRRVGARLASGKVEVLDVYRVEHFSLGSNTAIKRNLGF